MKIAMISLSDSCIYAGRRHKVGAEFEVNGSSDARLLIAIGRADFAPARALDVPQADVPQADDEYVPSVVDAATAAAIDAAVQESAPYWVAPVEEEAPKPKRRQYKRRDMSAED